MITWLIENTATIIICAVLIAVVVVMLGKRYERAHIHP